jgi:hypothetical protein
MKPRIYISVGSASTPEQAQASDAIFRSLEAAGLAPRQMEKNEWTAEQPLRGIRRVIEQCHGIVVIAFERYRFAAGTERQKDGGTKPLTDVRMTTVWNQIEAAMGYTKGIPLLVIAENGLFEDGLLEGRYDWKVYWTDFTADQLRCDRFIGYLESWKQLVLERLAAAESIKSNPEIDPSKMSLMQLCGRLTVPQIWAAVCALFGAFAAMAAVAFRAGAGKWPWG